MMPPRSSSRRYPSNAGLSALAAPAIAALALFSLFATTARAVPAGIYSVVEYDERRRPIRPIFLNVSGDGSTLYGYQTDAIWRHREGPPALFPTPDGGPPVYIHDLTPDASHLLSGYAVMRITDGETTELERPEVSFFRGTPTALSPNARYAAGSSIEGPGGFQPDVGRWTVGEGFTMLERGPFVGADAIGVTNDGTVYGHGFYDPYDSGSPFPQTFHDRAMRWRLDGTREQIEGMDGEGRAWWLRQIIDMTADGSSILGRGFVEGPPSRPGGPNGSFRTAVFDQSGEVWEFGVHSPTWPNDLGMAADGSLVYGMSLPANPGNTFPPPSAVPTIWTREGGRMTFRVYLRSMGLDPSEWGFSHVLDVSDDGRVFLVAGSEIGGNFATILVVIPEPGTAILLGVGLGLCTLTRHHRSRSTRRAAGLYPAS